MCRVLQSTFSHPSSKSCEHPWEQNLLNAHGKTMGRASLKATVCYQNRAPTLVSTEVVSHSLLLRHSGLLNKEEVWSKRTSRTGSHGHFHPEGEIQPTTTQVLQDNQFLYARLPALSPKGSLFGIHLFNVNSQKALPTSSQEFPTLPGKSPW